MSIMNPFGRRKVAAPPDLAGDPTAELTRVLSRIEAHLGELSARTRQLDKLDHRLKGIEKALREIY